MQLTARPDLRRYALSTLVNTLLQSEKPIPFEFLVSGTFLRTSIDQYLTAHGISSETTLTVEYVRAIIPPVYLTSFEHDDWVTAVDVLSSTSPVAKWEDNSAARSPGHERILSASYDGMLHVWNMSSEVLATSSPPTRKWFKGLKSAKFLSSSHVVSSSQDSTICVWKYDEHAEGLSGSLTPHLKLSGHKASVDSLAVHRPSSKILSASADHKVGIWSTKKSDAPEAPAPSVSHSNKRRKTTQTPESNAPPRCGPLALLEGHSDPVHDVIFAPTDPTVAYSTSMDGTLRTWDLPTQTLVDTRSHSRSSALFGLTALPTLNLVAAGTSERHITLIDPRTSATTVAAMKLRGHTNWVVSLTTDPGSVYGLLSGSHDGCCRIWDVRASKSEHGERVGRSVFVVERESTKGETREPGDESSVFSVHWDEQVGILSGGKDSRVQINRGVGVEIENKEGKESDVVEIENKKGKEK